MADDLRFTIYSPRFLVGLATAPKGPRGAARSAAPRLVPVKSNSVISWQTLRTKQTRIQPQSSGDAETRWQNISTEGDKEKSPNRNSLWLRG